MGWLVVVVIRCGWQKSGAKNSYNAHAGYRKKGSTSGGMTYV